ncbi:MAG TPA: alpha-amylase family glycosyl hydrolase [Rectinema sp.]|nr:alpha-amylase family glycosyl hydrolase [Rectinema sp.]
MALQILREFRSQNIPPKHLWMPSGAISLPDAVSARFVAQKYKLSAGELRALSLIGEAFRIIIDLYRKQYSKLLEEIALKAFASTEDNKALWEVLQELIAEFPPAPIYDGLAEPKDWLKSLSPVGDDSSKPNLELAIEQLILVRLFNENPAFWPYRSLFDDGVSPAGATLPDSISAKTPYLQVFARLEDALKTLPGLSYGGGKTLDLINFLREPSRHAPASLKDQLEWIIKNWGTLLGDFKLSLLAGIDMINEETRPHFPPGPGLAVPYQYRSSFHEYEKFSPDKNWMPSLVLIAKNALVWLHQLSRTYSREISRLDQIPEEELIIMAERGINGLWLIGIWQRSPASEKIKKLCGNSEAAASAYSLFDYEISPELGGWEALDRLREQCGQYGIRLAADMVPNHTGIDSLWIRTRPELFMSLPYCPFPSYSFNGPDLSGDPSIGIWLEDHYYNRGDAAVVFKRLDRHTGEVRYIYHGNDGTGMPWNDTAQIDFLNPASREAVKERILSVAAHFNIIRFDAAMVLAKQHIRRLWYPAPGSGGAIPSRSDHAMSEEAFDKAMPNEFWREVVDLCAEKASDTLLLAEAFWLMEGYFVRTLGMHRVYNSAFMNMLKDEKNSLYRLTIKNTQEFDRDILKRFVNFMSNPDEETAVAQFGKGDKYFGVATMLATMPGLPMIAHGQIEGFTEKYGMEYKRSYWDETPDRDLIARHEREIFPLLRMRRLFSEVENFYLFDYMQDDGTIDENVFAYCNGQGERRVLVFYNNHWERTLGRIHTSCAFARKTADGKKQLKTTSLANALKIDSSPKNYVIMHEIRSGLWYIFRSEDIASRGFKLALEGYQNKVFIDIMNVHDTEGRYTKLFEIVDSRGIADLDDALLEADQPELYRSLHNAINSLSSIETIQNLSQEEAIQRATIFSEIFFSRLCEIAGSDDTLAASRSDSVRSASSWLKTVLKLLYGTTESDAGIAAATLWNNSSASNSEYQQYRLILLIYSFMRSLVKAFAADELNEEVSRVVKEYRIAKKLTESAVGLSRRNDSHDTKYHVSICAEIAIAWALRQDKLFFDTRRTIDSTLTPNKRAQEICAWAFSDPLMREALNINQYRGTEYFNKERFEAFASLLPAFAWIDSIQEETKEREWKEDPSWKEVAEILKENAIVAGYRTGIMLELMASVAQT